MDRFSVANFSLVQKVARVKSHVYGLKMAQNGNLPDDISLFGIYPGDVAKSDAESVLIRFGLGRKVLMNLKSKMRSVM